MNTDCAGSVFVVLASNRRGALVVNIIYIDGLESGQEITGITPFIEMVTRIRHSGWDTYETTKSLIKSIK